MIKTGRILALAAALTALVASDVTPLRAQGVTTGAISGRVTDSSGVGIEAAQVQVINRATGFSTGTLSRSDGRYYVQSLEVGGPYSVNVRILGFEPQSRDTLFVTLGQNLRVDFVLIRRAAELATVEVTAEEDPVFSASHKGVQTLVSDSALRRLPTLNRNFTDFVRLTPQISTSGPGLSGGGVNNRFNNIQIDGASENDIFGLGSTGQPGGQARGKSITIEAVKEYQVLLTPFDVRQGNFAGVLINAVTKSGTNDFRATAFYYTRNEGLAQNSDFIRNSEFDQQQYGFSLGGPIIRDRLHFFVAPEWQAREAPAFGPFVGQSSSSTVPVPVDEADVARFTSILEGYGLQAGSPGRVVNENPLLNFFGRIDLALPEWNSRLFIRHNYGSAEDDVFSRSTASSNPTFGLTSAGFFFDSKKHATVGQLHTNFNNGANNELIVGYNRIRDSRTPNVRQPLVSVRVPNPNGGITTLQAGAEQFSQGNELDQDIFEITDNFSMPFGAHTITVGTHNEFFKIRNLFTESSFGVWSFLSLDDLEAGDADTYRLARDLGNGVVAQFNAAQYGFYAQDLWQVTRNLSLTFGLRADIPVLRDKPRFTPVVDTLYGRRTDVVPSGNLQWSPRLGFNWDIRGDMTQQLRGGVGVFVGRPAFVWIGNAFQNSGSNLGFLNCSPSSSAPGPAPAFTPDIESQPTACANGQGLATGVVGPVNLLDEDLKFPQTLRFALGYDRLLPGDVTLTLEGLYTKGLNNFFYINRNLVGVQGTDRNGRVMYGAINANATSNPSVVSNRFSEVIDVTNQSRDYAYNLTGQIQKRFSGAFEARGSYTYSKVRDVQTLGSSRAISNWQFGRTLSGDHLQENLGISLFDQPHKVSISGTYTLPWRNFKTDISLIYSGISGNPFDYVYTGSGGRGDLNADSRNGNDLVYVPTDANDPNEIIFDPIGTSVTPAEQAEALERFINESECLSEHRGQILKRNSCRSPWQNFLDLSIRQSLPSIRGNTLAVQLDIFNLPNLLNDEWGRIQSQGDFANVNLLTHVRQIAGPLETSQGVFTFNPATRQFNTENFASNYQVQLSVRYSLH
ncbi:MAG TPA: TonB-dependent receptor [Gemmatimonadaceae bacterium]|nr:TonB-dependent receptor [Gemmatimonadaceae bacterium]